MDAATPDAGLSCAELDCGAERLCEEADGLARCLDACEPGFDWQADTQSCAPVATCAELAEACTAEHRDCEDAADGAACGACSEGFEPDGGDCVAIVLCDGALGATCIEQNRDCLEAEAACGDCAAGFSPSASDACQARGDVCDADTPCATGDCLQLTAADDAHCMAPLCAVDQVWSRAEQACVAVDEAQAAQCAVDGGDGLWPVTALEGAPTCRTLDGFFYDSAAGQISPCDGDGDGWTRRSASDALEATDLAHRLNARCAPRSISGVVLENEWGQAQTIELAGAGLALYEPDALDADGAALDALLALPEGALPRPAAALNPLTKICGSRLADANANGVADVTEHHGSALDADWMVPFAAFTYFDALHTGRYEAPAEGDAHGTWHVAERGRCAADFPLGYGAAADDWWRSCTRRRAGDYAADAATFDFADTACEAEDGACAPAATRVGEATAIGQSAHGLCTDGLGEDPIAWRGMLHFSQFSCVALVADGAAAQPWQRAHTAVWTGANDGVLQLNRCAVGADGALSCAADVADTLSDAQRGGATETLTDEVTWVARRYADYAAADDYPGGCVNEWVEQRALCTYGGDDAIGYADEARFGQVVCDCHDPAIELPLAGNQLGACAGSQQICDRGQLSEPSLGAIDYCDGVDDDCDGVADEQTTEFCDGVDNDCDGEVDEGDAAIPGFICAPMGAAQIGNGPGALDTPDSLIEADRLTTLTHAFAISQIEATRAWADLLGVDGGQLGCEQDGCPYLLDFESALVFANLLSAYEGYDACYYFSASGKVLWPQGQDCSGYRLPTSAEWEYAARADGWQPDDLDAVAWCGVDAEYHAVCSLEANPWGLCDVLGNAAEWVWDAHAAPEAASLVDTAGAITLRDETDAVGPMGLSREADRDPSQLRGGAVGDVSCDLGARSSAPFDGDRRGFRLVRTVGPTPIHTEDPALDPPDEINTPLDLDPHFDEQGRVELNLQVIGREGGGGSRLRLLPLHALRERARSGGLSRRDWGVDPDPRRDERRRWRSSNRPPRHGLRP
jgi:hypothetical protein